MEAGDVCKHQKKYNTDKNIFLISSVSNCEKCFLSLYLSLLKTKNLHINELKIYSFEKWCRKNGRLIKKRTWVSLNLNNKSLGLTCKGVHPIFESKKKVRHNSFTCFPRYNGNFTRKGYKKMFYKKFKKMGEIINKY